MLAWLLPFAVTALVLPGISVGGFPEGGRLAAGARHTCVLDGAGGALCWGSNRDGQLGDGTREGRRAPTPVVGLRDAIELAAGSDHTCARRRDRSVVCWGSADAGQIGDGVAPKLQGEAAILARRRGEEGPARTKPTRVVDLGPADAIRAGGATTCALVERAAWCWGRGRTVKVNPRPRPIAGLEDQDELAVGLGFVCGRRGGDVTCAQEQVGEDPRTAPLAAIDDAVALAAGGRYLCVLHGSGRVTCFGGIAYTYERDRGRDPYAWESPQPIAELTDAVAIAMGQEHACALRRRGELRCWGMGSDGQLGHGLFQPWRRPVAALGLQGPRAVAGGNAHTCALSQEGSVLCWGSNDAGQLGWEPPAIEVPELSPGRRGRDEATWQLAAMITSSARPVPAWSPGG